MITHSNFQDELVMSNASPTILLTGATGYVGGRLLPRLVERGLRVRCVVRRVENLCDRVDRRTEVVHGDVLDADSPSTIPAFPMPTSATSR